MRTITQNIYNFEELAPAAQKAAIQNFYNDYNYINTEYEIFCEDIKTLLNDVFPNSDLNVQFDFSCTQGSGLNIYGDLWLFDFVDKWENRTAKERCTIEFYLNCLGHLERYFTLSENIHYTYSCKFLDSHAGGDLEIIEALQDSNIRNIKKDLIQRFFNDMIKYFKRLDDRFYIDGANLINDENIKNYIIDNDLEFTADGDIY